MTRGRLLLLFLIAAVAVACRVLPAWPLVFPHPGEIRFFEADPWFHVRQVHATVAQYPALNRWDRGTHYPTGERGMNQGLFDWGMATTAMILGVGHPSEHLVDLVAAWTPVVLSLVLIALVYWTARLVLPVPSAVLAAGLLALTPGSLATYSMLGFADHHILEDVFRVWMLGAIVRGWSRPQPLWRPAWWEALPAVLFLYSWAGASVDLAIAGLALLVAGTVAAALGHDVQFVMKYSFRYGVAVLLLYFPVAWVCPDAVMWEAARAFILAGGVGIALGVPLWLQAVVWLRTARPAAGIVLLAIILIGAAAAAFSPAGRWALDLLFAPRSPLVAEQQPATARTFLLDYGLVGILALYAIPKVALEVRRRRYSPAMVVLLVFAFAWLFLWWHTYDFLYAPPPFVALLAAAAMADWHAASVLSVGLVGVQVLLCGIGVTAWPWPSAFTTQDLMIMNDNWADAMAWLRTSTPPLPRLTGLGPFQNPVYPPGSYGVFTAWDDGEYVAGPGGRPCLWSEDMTPDYARWLMTGDESQATRMLDGWAAPGQRVRYVVLDSRMGTDYLATELHMLGEPFGNYFQAGPNVAAGILPVPSPLLESTMWYQLYRHDGQNLSHFRLVYETPGQSVAVWTGVFRGNNCHVTGRTFPLSDKPHLVEQAGGKHIGVAHNGYVYGAVQTPGIKIFEAVLGAHLVGQTTPGEVILVTLTLRTGASGRTFTYTVKDRSNATGGFDIVVPYPTQGADATDVVATDKYQLQFSGGMRQATVSVQDVETGAQVPVTP